MRATIENNQINFVFFFLKMQTHDTSTQQGTTTVPMVVVQVPSTDGICYRHPMDKVVQVYDVHIHTYECTCTGTARCVHL